MHHTVVDELYEIQIFPAIWLAEPRGANETHLGICYVLVKYIFRLE